MLQDIHPRRFDISYRRREPLDGDYAIVARDGRLLLAEAEERQLLPSFRTVEALAAGAADRSAPVYLFSIDEAAFHLFPGLSGETAGYSFQDAQTLRSRQPEWLAFAGATGSHLASWYGKNRHCGACGGPMRQKDDERALACTVCANVVYPRISPAVIVGVADGDRLLMTRYANRPYSRLALIAGFMEAGETLEDTVRREVMEEVGVRVRNIRYYKSQPWPFSESVLMGFFADLDGSPDITLDRVELQEAIWMRRGEIPPNDSLISLTAEMIDTFRRG